MLQYIHVTASVNNERDTLLNIMNYYTSKHNEILPTKNVKITLSYYAPAREVYRREHRAWTVHAQGEAGEAAWLRYKRADA